MAHRSGFAIMSQHERRTLSALTESCVFCSAYDYRRGETVPLGTCAYSYNSEDGQVFAVARRGTPKTLPAVS